MFIPSTPGNRQNGISSHSNGLATRKDRASMEIPVGLTIS